MNHYKKEERLSLTEKVYITKEAKKALRELKAQKRISMAKIVCNLIMQEYDKH